MGESLIGEVRREWSRAWLRPAQVPLTLFGNAALVTAAWFLIPRSWLFDFTGPWGFPVALAGWMFADVTATNVLAQDPPDALARLGDPAGLERWLRAKTVVLWLLVTPVSILVAIAVGVARHQPGAAVVVVAAICVVPMGALALSGWVGIVFPYHQRPLRWRWDNRHRFRSVIVRWCVLVLVPYGVFPAAVVAVLVVPVLVGYLLGAGGFGASFDPARALAVVAAAGVVSVVVWAVALRAAAGYAARRSDRIGGYLTDTDRG